MKITIIEGARGVGKSTIVKEVRNALINTVSINFTGHRGDDEESKEAILNHFTNFVTCLNYEDFDKSPFNYLFDRFFFSEMVYSRLYKSYDFSNHYAKLMRELDRLGKRVEIRVLHLRVDEDTMKNNLKREGKASLFGDDKLSDTVHSSMTQDNEYAKIFSESKKEFLNINFIEVNLSGKTLEEAIDLVKYHC